jgi:hypothetical protein
MARRADHVLLTVPQRLSYKGELSGLRPGTSEDSWR